MMPTLPDPLLAELSEWIAAHLGLHFPYDRRQSLERALEGVAREWGFQGSHTDLEACALRFLSGTLTDEQIATLARHLTVGETYFFRGAETFEALRLHVLPQLIAARRTTTRRLRIWSAGCASGEEPYSIAILLDQLLGDWSDWQVTLLATDINTAFLQRAAAGIYREWSFRGAYPWTKAHYFREDPPGHYAIHPAIQGRVRFARLNLATDAYPSPLNDTARMDLIFCRNVLMYFAPHQAEKVLERLEASLAEGGWLVVSPGEATLSFAARFEAVEFPGAILYRKKPRPEAAATPSLGTSGMNAPKEPYAPPRSVPTPNVPLRDMPLRPAAIRLNRSDHSKDGDTPGRGADRPLSSAKEDARPPAGLHDAIAQFARGDNAAAEEAARRALDEDPGDAAASMLLARIYANRREHAEALRWCKRAMDADRLDPLCYYLQANVHLERGNLEAAARSLKAALYLAPAFVMGHFALGNVALRQGKPRQAEMHFAHTLELLDGYDTQELVPESHGLTAGRLAEMIRAARTMTTRG